MVLTFGELENTLKEKFLLLGADMEVASQMAHIIVENDLDGVNSHGTGRIMRLVAMIREGSIKLDQKPECRTSAGAFEIWDGNLGPGVTNAAICMGRAIELAQQNGIGCVALRNTNHWLRGGTYGIQAAKKGCVGICWTNTSPNMPAWGTVERSAGNNPIVLAVPYKDSYVLMDGALAQYSYGALDKAAGKGQKLPFPGGYDTHGNLTTDPAEILKTSRVLPIGMWKGSGFSLLLDMIVSGLSQGLTVPDIGKHGGRHVDEYGLCQMFIAIKPQDSEEMDIRTGKIIESVKSAKTENENIKAQIPGENSMKKHNRNLENGIEVDDALWNEILAIRG